MSKSYEKNDSIIVYNNCQEMKTVVFFIGSLQAGGAEAKLARDFLPFLKVRGNVNPKLLLLQERGEFLEILPDGIERLSLNETSRDNLISLIPRFRDAVRRLNADVVVSFMFYPAIISYLTRKLGLADFRHIVHDTTIMSEYIKYEFNNERYKWLKVYLMKKAYNKAEIVIVVSEPERDDLIKNFKISSGLIHVIHDPINIQKICKMAEEDVDIPYDKPTVVSVGRLIYSKGFDVLLKAFKKVNDHIDSKLLILGTGEKKKELINLCESFNLKNKVIFCGFKHNPFKYMKRSHIFCTATRNEGLGNAMIEAMALGLPVIATDCPSGPAEILDNGKYGILVPPENPDALADAIIKVLRDKNLRQNMSRLSLERVQFFSVEKSMKQWEDIILRI